VEQNVIELIDLTKRYGSFTAVDNLNLTIGKGEIFGLLGPNGAGKSTTILMMMGLTEPTSGIARICGINSTTDPIAVRKKVGYLPEDVGFYDDYTGFENLVLTALLNRNTITEACRKAELILARVGLAEEAGKKAGKYSKGMRQRLGLADILIKDPEVIVLDEPTLGIDPKGVAEFLKLIVKLSKEEGHTVLFSSHHLHQVQEVCDRVGLFVGGRLIAEGKIGELSQKLFSEEPIIIEAGVILPEPDKAELPGDGSISGRLKQLISNINGVMTVDLENNLLQAGCSRDASDEIARAVIESGAGLKHLNKLEYGLDDIYHRYFEGVENHEKPVNE
jgi:ABC-2 type transport system ATP-binding protein